MKAMRLSNVGASPARYLALRFSGNEESKATVRNVASSRSVKLGGDQIEYEDEEPRVRQMFEAELAKRGVASQMGSVYKAAS